MVAPEFLHCFWENEKLVNQKRGTSAPLNTERRLESLKNSTFATLARQDIVVEAICSLTADFAQLVAKQLWGGSFSMNFALHSLSIVKIFQVLLNFFILLSPIKLIL